MAGSHDEKNGQVLLLSPPCLNFIAQRNVLVWYYEYTGKGSTCRHKIVGKS